MNNIIKVILRDLVYQLLVLNMILVIIGYSLGTVVGDSAVEKMRFLKSIVILFSFIIILYKNGFSTKYINNSIAIYLVITIVFLLSFVSNNPLRSIYKSLTFINPFLYVLYSINYLLKYGVKNLIIALSIAIMVVYSIVVLAFFIGNQEMNQDIKNEIIYGYKEGSYFYSNHYGWASALVLLSALTIIRFYKTSFLLKILIYVSLPFIIYLLFLSANRASILAVFIALIFYIIKDKRSIFFVKFSILAISIFAFVILYYKLNTVFEFLQQKNEMQLETGQEGRLIGTKAMLESFNSMPVYWLTGVGMFNYTELKMHGGLLSAYHNSYWEILFGSGIITFLLFLNFMVLRPFISFWKKTSTHSLLFIPLVLIPFFESNLTAGQFLFFPWFSYMLLLNAKELKR